VETIHDYGAVTAHEAKLIEGMTPDFLEQAEEGFTWAKAN